MTHANRRLIEAMQELAGRDLDAADADTVRAEFAEDGLAPAIEASLVAERLDAVVAQFMRDRAAAAKALRAATTQPGSRRRPGVQRMRALVRAAFAHEPQLEAAFRDGAGETDQDIRHLYDDLVALGKIGRKDR